MLAGQHYEQLLVDVPRDASLLPCCVVLQQRWGDSPPNGSFASACTSRTVQRIWGPLPAIMRATHPRESPLAAAAALTAGGLTQPPKAESLGGGWA